MPSLAADDIEGDVNVAARCMRIGADLFVSFLNEARQLGLRQAFVLDAHLNGEPEAAAVARADGCGTCHPGFARILLVLFRDEVEGAAEAGGVARREQVLGRRCSGLAGAAHLLRHRQVGLHRAIA